MATTRSPRHGSLQFWPRRRAKRQYSRVRHYPRESGAGLLGFAGYKAGMTHVIAVDNRQMSHTKGMEVAMPVTVIECPPLKVASVRFYKKTPYGLRLSAEVFGKADKELGRKACLPKKTGADIKDFENRLGEFSVVRVNVYTQPKFTSAGKKKPELFELGIGGSVHEQFKFASESLGMEIRAQDVLKEGQQVDVYAVTKGKGFQGAVKRFGVTLRSHKSEKGVRGPGNVGPWTGNRSWTVAHAGQMGYHNRMERNKWILKVSDDVKAVQADGGFLNYGVLRNSYVIVKGSVQGPRKRLVRLVRSQRRNHLVPEHAPQLLYISTESKQGL
ncbi:50S ribosomal protein L3 [Candidatus Woesearchaeota archaeon]|nr:50S ribosomal protein L3 [Candidatus Woesearchaeota archaeon]